MTTKIDAKETSMETIRITKADIDSAGFWTGGAGIGKAGSPAETHVEIEASTGWVKFCEGLYVAGKIVAKAGSGIEAGLGVYAGEGIEAGLGIDAGWGIGAGRGVYAGSGIEAGEGVYAGEGIRAGSGVYAGRGVYAGEGIRAGSGVYAGRGVYAGEGIKAGSGVYAGSGIEAGLGIDAGRGIDAGSGIKAGRGIKAGEGIYAGRSIKAGLGIRCVLELRFNYWLFAGTDENYEDADNTVVCGRIVGGDVGSGEVVELGMPETTRTTSPESTGINTKQEGTK